MRLPPNGFRLLRVLARVPPSPGSNGPFLRWKAPYPPSLSVDFRSSLQHALYHPYVPNTKCRDPQRVPIIRTLGVNNCPYLLQKFNHPFVPNTGCRGINHTAEIATFGIEICFILQQEFEDPLMQEDSVRNSPFALTVRDLDILQIPRSEITEVQFCHTQ